MNKTVTVNIGGMVFHIEELAYDKLKNYLQTIRSHFSVSDGRDEIIEDIESRIAEILLQILGKSRQVVTSEDVDQVMSVMGKPEDFSGADDAAGSTSQTNGDATATEATIKRRLYRDPDERVIAGVCSGLGHYFGIDAVWLRLLFIIIFFMGFSGLLIYIVLAIILPKAITPTQKLEMRGDPVNISTIRKETESPAVKHEPSGISNFFDLMLSGIKIILKGIVYIITAFFAFIALIVLFSIGMAIMAMLGVGGLTIPVFISDQFLSRDQQMWTTVAFILLFAIPALWIIIRLVKWMFNIKYNTHRLNVAVGILFILGLAVAFFNVYDIARDFAKDAKIRNTVEVLNPSAQTLSLRIMDDPKYDEESHSRIFSTRRGNFSVTTGSDFVFNQDNVDFKIEKAPTDQFELIQVFSAEGRTEKEAMDNAKSIKYNFEQKDSTLMLSDHFPIPKGVKYRQQKVLLILKVPVGKSIYIDESMVDILDDIDNVTNTWDGDMGGHTWKMTDAGLMCTDFDFTTNKSDTVDSDDVDINIDQHGIRIKGKDASDKDKNVNIKIDKSGMHVKTEDAK